MDAQKPSDFPRTLIIIEVRILVMTSCQERSPDCSWTLTTWMVRRYDIELYISFSYVIGLSWDMMIVEVRVSVITLAKS